MSVVAAPVQSARRQFAEDRNTTLIAAVVCIGAVVYPLIDWLLDLGTLGVMFPIVVYILLALGLNIVVGFAGLLDLGYAAFFAIGAYTIAILTSPRSPILTGLPVSMDYTRALFAAFFLTAIIGALVGMLVFRLRERNLLLAALGSGVVGALIAALFTPRRLTGIVIGLPFRLNFWGALILGFFVAALFGVILGAPTLRLRGDYLAIVTLGFGEIVPVVFRNAEKITFGEQGLNALERPAAGGFALGKDPVVDPYVWYYLLIILGFLIIFMARRLRDSRLGRAWMAMREDEIAAGAMGIDLVKTKLFAFALGASFSGLAGVIYASWLSFAAPSQFEFSTSVLLLAMVILGGLGNIWGVIIGGLLLGLFDRVLTVNLGKWINSLGEATNLDLPAVNLTQSRFGIFGLTLVLMMLLRPQGLLPNAQRKAELQADTPEGGAQMDQSLYDQRGEPV